MEEVLATARRIADGVFWPAASTVDSTGEIPPSHLDTLAAAGYYGLLGPASAGGLGLAAEQLGPVVEVLASGCLATTFVWLQHAGAVRAVATSSQPGVPEAWLGPLSRGERRAGAV